MDTVLTGAEDFYPRSPRGERPGSELLSALGGMISIHAPREGSDQLGGGHRLGLGNFYPRSPRGERLKRDYSNTTTINISIHAPREGSDSKCAEK